MWVKKKSNRLSLSTAHRDRWNCLKKGASGVCRVIVDLDQHELVGLVNGRTHAAIEQEQERWGEAVLGQIKEVSIDWSGNYCSLIQKRFPNAEIVADRFHVSKLINDTLNQAGITEKKALKEIDAETESARLEEILKNSKYALLKPEKNLTEKQAKKLEAVKEAFLLLAQMHQQKEDFKNLFDDHQDWTTGTFALMDWMKDAETIFKANK